MNEYGVLRTQYLSTYLLKRLRLRRIFRFFFIVGTYLARSNAGANAGGRFLVPSTIGRVTAANHQPAGDLLSCFLPQPAH